MTTLIDLGCSVWDEYGTRWSGGHSFTTQCRTNMKVNKHDIELQCWWSTDRANGVRTVQWSMIHNYLEVCNMQQDLICPSKACLQGPVFWTQSDQTRQTMGSGISLETRWDEGAFPFLLEGTLPIFWGGIFWSHLPGQILLGQCPSDSTWTYWIMLSWDYKFPHGIDPRGNSLRGRC